jgi:hypothetical protein
MKKNIGTPDRLIRLVIALALLGLAYWRGSWILLLASLFVFFEVYFSWCLFYQIIGKNSCPRK